jgi:hypothetical protein
LDYVEEFKKYCLENKYSKWYFSIINFALKRNWSKRVSFYVEKHHIFPKSILNNKKTVCLTPKEHYICHLLLPKMLKKSEDKIKMVHALWKLSNHMKDARNIKINSSIYKKLKENISKIMSEKNKNFNNPQYNLTGDKHPAFGYRHTENHKEYMSKLFSGKNNPMYGKKFPKHIIDKKSKNYTFLYNDEKIEIFNLRKFCRENNLDQGAMIRVNSGKQIKHKGYFKYV